MKARAAFLALLAVPPRPSTLESAFTRVELAVVLGAMALLVLWLGPALANTRQNTEHALCVNNLRLMGRATHIWGSDHGGNNPTHEPVGNGGVMGHPLAGNAWFQFAWLSNELANPRVLVCPADTKKKAAVDFGGSSDGGFVNTGYRDNAVSYFLGSDAFPDLPESFLYGDRNVRIIGYGGCSTGITVGLFNSFYAQPTLFTNAIHGAWGNVLHFDGHVSTLVEPIPLTILRKADEGGSVHLVLP